MFINNALMIINFLLLFYTEAIMHTYYYWVKDKPFIDVEKN